MKYELSVVIPAYNETARLGQTVQTVLRYLNEHWAGRAELIVVDDGSTDATAQVARESLTGAGATRAYLLPLQPNRGKGFAVRTAMLCARGEIVLFSDADLSTPITETPKLTEPIRKDQCDLAFGSRALDRRLIEIHQPWRREQGGRVFNWIVRFLTGLTFRDTQCGFKAFRAATCRPIFEAAKIDRFGFDVEWLYIAQLAGVRLCEIPVRWLHQDGSKVAILRDSWRMFNEVCAIRQQARRGAYAAAIEAIQAARPLAQRNAAAARQFDHGNDLNSNRPPELLAKARHV